MNLQTHKGCVKTKWSGGDNSKVTWVHMVEVQDQHVIENAPNSDFNVFLKEVERLK